MNVVTNVFLSLFLLVFANSVHALRSIDTESFTDPDYKSYIPNKVVLLASNVSRSMQKEIEESAKQKLEKVGVTVVMYEDLFPPTREWTEQDESEVFRKEGIDSGIVISFGTRSQSIRNIGTHTFGTANFNSYGASGSATTVNINRAKSEAEFSVVLKDIKTMRTAWYADITTKAGGAFFVGEERDARAAIKGMIAGLKKDGHLPVATEK